MPSCDPKDLVAAAKCMTCIPPEMTEQVKLSLLCNLATSLGGGGGGTGIGAQVAANTAAIAAMSPPAALQMQVSFTGPLLRPFIIITSGPNSVAIVTQTGDNAIVLIPGVWMHNSFLYTEVGANLGSLTTLSFDNLVGLDDSNSFSPTTMAALTSLSLPQLQYVGGTFGPALMAALTTLSIPKLAYVVGAFTPNTMAALTTLSAPNLIEVASIFGPTIMGALTTFSFPLLTYVGGNFSPNTMASLTTVSLPSLLYVGGTMTINTMASLTTVSFPTLKRVVGSIGFQTDPALTTVSLPALVSIGNNITMGTGNGNITSITLGTVGITKSIGSIVVDFSGQKLNVASVNSILALFVSLDGTNGTTLFTGGTKSIALNGGTSAAPTGQGIIDKATLIARGITVTTN